MIPGLAADLVVLAHFGFILFVALGGFLALRWRKIAWVHFPCVSWGVLIEWFGWLCPLTPLEYRLRKLAGEAGYTGGFIDHYIVPLVYPAGLTRKVQIGLGVLVLLINLLVYGRVLRVQHRRRQEPPRWT